MLLESPVMEEPTIHVTHRLIAQEIKDWSSKVLEVPSQVFNGLPPCPYAKKAWAKDKVRMHITGNIKECLTIKEDCPDDDSVDVVAWTGYGKMSADEFDQWLDEQNEKHDGIWIIGFHPDHPADEALEEFEGNGTPEYALILIQSLRHLVKSSESIFKRGYYKNYSQFDINHIKKRNIL